MPRNLERLVAKMEAVGRPKVKWLISDVCAWWSFDVAERLGIRVASFLATSAASLGINLKIPKLTEDGLINSKGWPEREETFQLAPGVPPLHTSNLPWNNAGAAEGQPTIFELCKRMDRLSTLSEMVVCNSFHEAEAGAFKLLPNVLPIGPLSSDAEFRKPVGQFLLEDTRCLRWLDTQPDSSVVYVAFGSTTIFDPCQFKELALGLELTGRPFLLVIRPDFTTGELSKAWFDEFQAGVAGKGMLVSWCPQQQVTEILKSISYYHYLLVSSFIYKICDGWLCFHGVWHAGAGAPGGGVLRVALWVELDDGGGPERRAARVLAILCRTVSKRELHLQRVEDRSGGVTQRRWDRDQGGAEEQGEAGRRQR
ncbi:unnamed protein product [Urochloa humidicola]